MSRFPLCPHGSCTCQKLGNRSCLEEFHANPVGRVQCKYKQTSNMERETYRRFQAAAAFPATEVRQLPPRRTVSEEPVSSFWCVEKNLKKRKIPAKSMKVRCVLLMATCTICDTGPLAGGEVLKVMCFSVCIQPQPDFGAFVQATFSVIAGGRRPPSLRLPRPRALPQD